MLDVSIGQRGELCGATAKRRSKRGGSFVSAPLHRRVGFKLEVHSALSVIWRSKNWKVVARYLNQKDLHIQAVHGLLPTDTLRRSVPSQPPTLFYDQGDSLQIPRLHIRDVFKLQKDVPKEFRLP